MSRKQKAFRWLTVLGVPLVVLLGAELALRLAGWGYPTRFFVRAENGPAGLFAENPRFGWRFFPQRLARAPDPIRLSKNKPAGTYRIYVFGESAALGDPEPAYGFSRILQELLEERCPGTKFEVINVAMTAINSHAILRIARECVPFQGDFWIIYMGNNEVVGPFGAGSVFGAKSPPRPFIQASLAIKRTRVGQALDALVQRALFARQAAREWEGMRMMVEEQIRAADTTLRRVYDHFARNLSDILSTATRVGVKPIVCSLSSNLKDCPPCASLHRTDLSEARQAEWSRLFVSGKELESRTNFAQALTLYRQAAEIDDTYAELSFRMARRYLALGNAAAALKQYIQARDLDALRFRADTQINRVLRQVCADRAAEGVSFFDAEAVLAKACKLGISGKEYFWDHVHFNFAGNYLMARGLADQIFSLLPESVRRSTAANQRILSEAECAERLAYTDWDQLSVLRQMWRRVHDPPFTGQLDHELLIQQWSGLRSELERKTGREGLTKAVPIYRKALDRRADDWMLHHRLALLLEVLEDLSGAERHWQRVVELVPSYVDAWFKLGDINLRRTRLAEAGQYYRHVLRLRPTSVEAMNGLGLVRMGEGRLDEAVKQFEQALRMKPNFAEAHVNWGLLMARRGMIVEAESHYREALRGNPESRGAHINLANLLAARQKHAEASEHYRKALELQPNEAMVHLGLGNCLLAIGRHAEALAHYQEAVGLNPALSEAQFNLGVALAKKGDLVAATACFQEAVRLTPEDPQAHLSLGVALAQQNRLEEAITQFRAVLQLDPANRAAKQYLDTATRRAKPKR